MHAFTYRFADKNHPIPDSWETPWEELLPIVEQEASAAIVCYCLAWAKWCETYKGQSGTAPNPAHDIIRKGNEHLRRAEEHLLAFDRENCLGENMMIQFARSAVLRAQSAERDVHEKMYIMICAARRDMAD
jgi:hypothetical protein